MVSFRPDPLGLLDTFSGLLLLYTVSPLPEFLAAGHAAFLIFKGIGTLFRIPLPLPVYVLGGAADVLSAAILFTGKPPIFVGYKSFISGALLLKGVWSLLGFMQ